MSDYSDYQHLVITVDDGVATVRMNRPERLNAFNTVLGLELLRVTDDLREDPNVRCVILTGTGRGFCSGVDTTDNGAGTPFTRQPLDEIGYSGRLPLAWYRIDKPTIAAINGVAAGGGVALALLQDIRIMAESARLLPMFIARGNSPEVATSWYAPRLIGLQRALEWFYTGEPMSSAEAKETGLVRSVVPDDQLMDEAMALAKKIAAGPTIGVRLTRRTLYHGITHDLESHILYETSQLNVSTHTEDAAEARAALAEKRKPVFTGR
jgi:2-(1,2-epoxy-1,2-dihydrophenyl)acetyl-CoA isomerase